MDHVAILSKKRNILDKILSGEKKIESRWYKSKKTPYGVVKAGDKIYLKETGEPVTAIADVDKVLFFGGTDEKEIQKIINQYGKEIWPSDKAFDSLKETKYVTLIYVKNPHKIEPFAINKKGYGVMAAWISVEDINSLKD